MTVIDEHTVIPSKTELSEAAERVRPYVHRTPVLSSTLINEILGNEIVFKCENFQRMGAFKMRGAINAVFQLSPVRQRRGVVTHSSGNFAQALALAARLKGIQAHIVMPSTAPKAKVEAVKSYGGKVIVCGPTIRDRELKTQEIIDATGATFIHPSDNEHVIIGQGTAAIELFEEHPDLDCLFVPVGGGGLIGGSSLAARHFSPNTLCYGAEPENADDAKRSLEAGHILQPESPDTIADGLKTYLGEHNFPVIKQCVHDIVLVSEDEIIRHMRLIWERMKIIVEPSSAVALAGVSKSGLKGKRIGVILSGGNVDLDKLPF